MLKESRDLQIEIGRRLTELRKHKGYSSHESFALDHDLPGIHYCRLENGKTNHTIRTLSKVLAIHGLTIEEFFNPKRHTK
jgi:hypothetical protein